MTRESKFNSMDILKKYNSLIYFNKQALKMTDNINNKNIKIILCRSTPRAKGNIY